MNIHFQCFQRFALVVVCWWLVLAAGLAQEPPPYLWKIEGPKPSYIFGTMHLSHPTVARLRRPVLKAIESCDVVLCEIPLDAETASQISQRPVPAKYSLAEALPSDLYERARQELKSTGLQIRWNVIDKMPVWEFAIILDSLDEILRFPGKKRLDQMIYEWGEAARKEVGGIETVEEHMAVMDVLTREEQIEWLRSALAEFDQARKNSFTARDELRAFYLAGDIDALQFKLNEHKNEMSTKFYEALLTKRNRNMALRIHGKSLVAPDKACFFAFGCAHLPGDTGVIKLLEKLGHKLTRVTE